VLNRPSSVVQGVSTEGRGTYVERGKRNDQREKRRNGSRVLKGTATLDEGGARGQGSVGGMVGPLHATGGHRGEGIL